MIARRLCDQRAIPSQFIARGIVPGKARPHHAAIFGIFCGRAEPVEATGVSYRGTAARIKCRLSIRLSQHSSLTGDISMTITAAHIPADRGADRWHSHSDHAALSQFRGRDLSDLHRLGRSRRCSDGCICSGQNRASRLARDRSKWCKARNFLLLSRIICSHGQSRTKTKKTAAKSKPSCRPGPRPRRRPRPARR